MTSKVDWSYLRMPLCIFFTSLMIAFLMIITSKQYENTQQAKYNKSLSALHATLQNYNSTINDIDRLKRYSSQYAEYKASGLVGVERRLSWIESLKKANKVLQLPTINYNLLPQQTFTRLGFKVKESVEVNGSIMDLRMGLLHEGDLFTLIDSLIKLNKNMVTVESCSIKRSSPVSSTLSMEKINLRSNCRLRWININAQ